MALTSASTLAQAIDQFLANSNWAGSPSAAADRKQAIDWLLFNRPQSYSIGGRSMTLDYPLLQAELAKINDYLFSNPGTAGSRRRFARARVTGVGRW